MQILWITLEAETVSIFILIDGDAGGFFFIILWILIYLFVCACEFTYFSVLIKLLNNKVDMQ
jgi:hypothetical protein